MHKICIKVFLHQHKLYNVQILSGISSITFIYSFKKKLYLILLIMSATLMSFLIKLRLKKDSIILTREFR